ncbi:MAG TPA: sugar phosphate nucleotidyltransferase [Candidatus Saccharimonadales bacterium]|nr:sugar phosphate nucleotidyltransferase [Candidatus Saccharimonadales bacterium]
MTQVTKAVIAAAGFGTRFLPQTKAMPKEMLPLIDKPIIQYVVEELVEAGIKDIIIVGSSNKRAIEDHFDTPSQDLVANLMAGGDKKRPLLEQVEKIGNMANFVYVRQKGPYGNATPIAAARHLLGNEPFIYTFADDFFVANPGRTQQLIEVYNRYNGSVFACRTVQNDDEYNRYGIVAGDEIAPGLRFVDNVIEKPGKDKAPSNMASVSGYLLMPDMFPYLDKAIENFEEGTGELMIQPIMQAMIDDGHSFYAREIQNGTYYDTGDKLEYIKTVIDFAMKDPALCDEIVSFIQSKTK